MPELTRYLQRVSFLLRQGQPANDIALYLPNSDARAQFRDKHEANLFEALHGLIGKDIIPALLNAGYDFDFFDDEALRAVGQVEPGALLLGTNRYKAVILPNVERIPPQTLRTLADFTRCGGSLIATRRLPESAPGFRATEAEQKEVGETVPRLFEGSGAPGHFVPDEKAALAAQLTALVPPDVIFAGVSPAYLQGNAHRRLDFGPAKALPVESLRNGTRAWIDAPVREAALVFLNGARIGTLWHPPYTLDITHALRPGLNQLEIIVGNTAINHLAGAHPAGYQPLNRRYGERFKPQDMDKLEPLPSGLLAPVRIVP